ncbi:MAG: hypothetical protein EOP24_41750 [Hyphomicrobiales bacterium]|nr:MAG: hypothetical protein EOP24_41750 [Hyphomicrobiales bacterium]
MIGSMRRGSYIINNARGQIVDGDAIVRALESGGSRSRYGGPRMKRARTAPTQQYATARRPCQRVWNAAFSGRDGASAGVVGQTAGVSSVT